MRLFTTLFAARSSKPVATDCRAVVRIQRAPFETLERREMMSASPQAAAPAVLNVSHTPTVEMSLSSPRSITLPGSRISGPTVLPPVFITTAIMGKYKSLPSQTRAILGSATTDERSVTGIPGAKVQFYKGGAIYWSSSTGAHVVYGEIGQLYAKTASMTDAFGRTLQPILGLPTSDEINVPGKPGARMNTFKGGTIYWSAATGAHVVYGAIGDLYKATATMKDAFGNSVQPILGLPTSDEMNVPGKPGARMSTFQGGAIYWTAEKGAFVVYGDIGRFYMSHGGPTGEFGLPKSNESGFGEKFRVQDFEGGSIGWTPVNGAYKIFSGPILKS